MNEYLFMMQKINVSMSCGIINEYTSEIRQTKLNENTPVKSGIHSIFFWCVNFGVGKLRSLSLTALSVGVGHTACVKPLLPACWGRGSRPQTP